MRWLMVIVVLAVAVAAGVFLYQRFATPTVTVTEAIEAPVVQAFYATGTLQPKREYPVNSNVEGIVTEMSVDKGDHVAAGQKIAFVRVEEYQMRHSQAQADLDLARQLAKDDTSPALLEYEAKLKAANEQLQIALDELKRLTEAQARNAASQMDLDRARDRVQVIWSIAESIKAQKAAKKLELDRDVTVAQAALDIAKWNLDQQTILSPTTGVVLDRPVTAGTRVKVNDHLLQIADVSPETLVMRSAVDEEDKTRVHEEQRVVMTLYSYPGRIFEGLVKQVYPKADPDRRTFEVDLSIQMPDPAFAAGMTGELAFIVEAKDRALVVPSQAVQNGAVWTVRDGRLVKADVRIGLRSIERAEILSGIAPGDKVVISPVSGIAAGQSVQTQFMDPVTAAGLNKPTIETPIRGLTGNN